MKRVQIIGNDIKQTQIGVDSSVTFANSDPVNTQKIVTITAPSTIFDDHMLIVYNPSTVTDLTVKVFNVELGFASATRDALLTTITVPKASTVTGTSISTYANTITGAFKGGSASNGGDLKLVVSNATVLGATDGFTASFRIRAV